MTDVERARIRRVLELAIPAQRLEWMTASCPSIEDACAYALEQANEAHLWAPDGKHIEARERLLAVKAAVKECLK